MKDIILSLLLGIAIGALMSAAYYDGFVADEYKQRIATATSALNRAGTQINQKNDDINKLTIYIDSLIKYNKKLEQIVVNKNQL